MPSENARAVAQEVIATVRKGQKVNKGAIIKRHGYSDTVSKRPSKVTDTDSYKQEINPVVKAMEKERDAILKALPKMRSKAKYRDLIDGADKMTKNIQLLSGGKTSNDKVSFNWED